MPAAALNVDSRIMICMDRKLLDTNIKSRFLGSEQFFLGLFKSDLEQGILESTDSNIRILYIDTLLLPNGLPGLFEAGVHFVASPKVDVMVRAAKKHGIRPLKPHYAAKD